MMTPNNLVRKTLINKLEKSLKTIGSYDVASLFPFFFVLVALKEGHRVYLEDKTLNAQDLNKSALLKNIRCVIDEHYFKGEIAQEVYIFYESLGKYNITDYYRDIIEHIIASHILREGRYSGISITPTEVAQLMATLIKSLNPNGIYDPCAGLCSFSMLRELELYPFLGQEINPITKVIAQVRLDAANKKATILNGNCLQDWQENILYDCLASELPFGIRLNEESSQKDSMVTLEDFVVQNFIKSKNLNYAVMMISTSTWLSSGNIQLRKALVENNYVEGVIKLPASILPYTGISPVILILNKHHTTNNIKFLLADDCVINGGKKHILDYKTVIQRFQSDDSIQTTSVPLETIVNREYSLVPAQYVKKKIDISPGQKLVRFSDLTEPIVVQRRFDEKTGKLLLPENMYKSIVEMHTRAVSIDERALPPSCVKISSKCIIFNVRAEAFFIKDNEETLFVSTSYKCFKVMENKCLPEYLVNCVLKATEAKENAMRGNYIQRVDFNNLLLPIYENIDSQRNIIQRIYREEQNEIQKKLEKLKVLSGKSSDLVHNLGVTFTKISAAIGTLRIENDNETLESLYDNVKFALRQINSTGTDFTSVTPKLEKVVLLDALEKYVRAWNHFGFKTFDILPTKSNLSVGTKVKIDLNLFYTVLDCLFINAHQHGFHKNFNSDNKLWMEIEGVIYQNEQYIRLGVSNNGMPLPDNFTLQDFVTRGVVGINSSQDGIGGDHIYKITHHFGGLVSIDSDSEWLTFNILLPVYLTSTTTNFKNYECECV